MGHLCEAATSFLLIGEGLEPYGHSGHGKTRGVGAEAGYLFASGHRQQALYEHVRVVLEGILRIMLSMTGRAASARCQGEKGASQRLQRFRDLRFFLTMFIMGMMLILMPDPGMAFLDF